MQYIKLRITDSERNKQSNSRSSVACVENRCFLNNLELSVPFCDDSCWRHCLQVHRKFVGACRCSYFRNKVYTVDIWIFLKLFLLL